MLQHVVMKEWVVLLFNLFSHLLVDKACLLLLFQRFLSLKCFERRDRATILGDFNGGLGWDSSHVELSH